MAQTLILIPRTANWGGVTTFYRNLRPCWGDEVVYWEYFSSRDGRGGLNAVKFFLKNNFALIRILRRNRPDVVMVNPSMGSTALIRDGMFLLLSKLFGKKVIVFNHGWDVKFVPRLEIRWLWLYRAVFFKADAFIVLAGEFADTLKRWGYRKPIHLATTHVADDFWHKASERPAFGSDVFRILFLARVEKLKGIEEVLLAFELLRRRHPDKKITLTCAGDGLELAYWREYATKHGIPAEFPGLLSDDVKIAAFLNADCYLLPSYTEGMPASVLEAMSFRLPIVIHLIGGLKDLFQPIMGEASSSLAPEEYAAMLERLLNSPERSVVAGEYNREYVGQNCLSSVIAKKLDKIFSDITHVDPGQGNAK